MKTNRYFIISNADPNFQKILKLAVGTSETQRQSLCGNFTVIKLPLDDDSEHDLLKDYAEYTHEEILEKLNCASWCEHIKQKTK